MLNETENDNKNDKNSRFMYIHDMFEERFLKKCVDYWHCVHYNLLTCTSLL